jgi:hypothetical protein
MPSPKTVKVTVTQSQPGADPAPALVVISVDEDPVSLKGHGHGAGARIHWDIVTPGWTFAPKGIVIEGHGGRFSDQGPSNLKRRHSWQRDQAPDGQHYKYAISVTDGTAVATWDPYIIND